MAFLALLVSYHLIFSGFFLTRNETLGHDWSWIIPGYLRDYADYLRHGMPFFSNGELFRLVTSPAACHSPIYYLFSVPHDLVSWLIALGGLDPVQLAYAQLLFYASVGYAGMYLLLNRVFALEPPMAVLGAGLFMFNGFYAHRIMIGHLFFSVMLLPLLVYCLTHVPKTPGHRGSRVLLWGVLAGVVAYYAFTLRVSVVIVGFMLGMLGVLAIWLFRGGEIRELAARSGIALVVAVGLAFQWLYATTTSEVDATALAQRVSYALPVFRDLQSAVAVWFDMLFLAPADIEHIYARSVLNHQILQQRHELEFGVSPIPLLLLVYFFARKTMDWLRSDEWGPGVFSLRQWMALVLAALVLLFPILYTTDFPGLLPLIKRTPLISITTSPQRTYFAYTVLIPMLSVLAVARFFSGRRAWPVTIAALAAVVVFSGWKNRDFYHDQPYDPVPILNAHRDLRNGGQLPPIERIGLLSNEAGQVLHDQMIEANLFLKGVQHMGCYIPAYGSTPVGYLAPLHPGPIREVTEGSLNIKNPACISWPVENGCRPGAHFKVGQEAAVDRYVRYEPFPVVVPDGVRRAAWVSAASFFAVIGLLAWFGFRRREPVE